MRELLTFKREAARWIEGAKKKQEDIEKSCIAANTRATEAEAKLAEVEAKLTEAEAKLEATKDVDPDDIFAS